MKNSDIFMSSFTGWLKAMGGVVSLIALIVIFGRLLYFNLMLKYEIDSHPVLSLSDRFVMLISGVFVIMLVLIFIALLFFVLRFIARAFKACVEIFLK